MANFTKQAIKASFMKLLNQKPLSKISVRDIVEEGILTQIRQEDGCLAYDYYFSAQDENEVLLIERWESAAHQRVHMEQPHMARLREIKDKYIAATKLGRVHLED